MVLAAFHRTFSEDQWVLLKAFEQGFQLVKKPKSESCLLLLIP